MELALKMLAAPLIPEGAEDSTLTVLSRTFPLDSIMLWPFFNEARHLIMYNKCVLNMQSIIKSIIIFSTRSKFVQKEFLC